MKTLSYSQIRELVCAAVMQKMGGSAAVWMVDCWDDHCIYRDDATDKYYQAPYSILEGVVTLGDAVEVEKQVDYVKVQAGFRIVAAAGQPADADFGYRWRVQIIDAGPDKQSGIDYPHEVLKAAKALYEGARVFALTQGQHADPQNPFGKSVKDLVGWLSGVNENASGLEGDLNILKSAAWLRDMVVDAFNRGKPDLVGLSHDVLGKVVKKRVEKIAKVDSVDVVYDPIAGGKFIRMAAASQRGGRKEEAMLEKLLAALKAARPDAHKEVEGKIKAGTTVTEDEVIALLAAAQSSPADLDTRIQAGIAKALEGKGGNEQAAQLLEQTRISACGVLLKDELRESGLPELAQARIRKDFEGKAFEITALQAAVSQEKDYLDKLTGAGVVTGAGGVRMGNEEPEKIQAAFDKLLGVTVDQKFTDVPAFRSIRAAYTRVTGDQDVSGQISRDGVRIGLAIMDFMRLPAAYASNSFSYLLGTSMYRRLVQDYRATDWNEAILLSYIRNAADFKTMESIRVGYYGDLPDVDPEAADYVELTNFTDEEVSYAINQKGGLVTVTRKTIKNDDLRSLEKIPQRLGRAARRTKAQRVWNKIINNSTYKGDSKNVFHNDHANLGAVALSADAAGITALTNRLQAMFAQTEPDSAAPLALEAEYIWVPRALLEIAKTLNSPWPGAATPNPHAGRFGSNHERIVVNKLTSDASDWGLVANKADTDLLEIAYMNGQEEPEFFVADNPLVGQMFLADKIQFKIRHEYEVEIDDYRGLDKSVVG